MRVKVSLDDVCYKTKPVGKEPGIISKRLGDRPVEADLEWIAHRVGVEGYTFCTAWFDGKRKEEYFSQTQLFGLDFDENITYKEAASRAEMCNLPISFSYKTFSWTEEHEKFRLVFCHVVPITEMGLAKMMLEMLMKIFPEADKACSDTSRMFYGGKGMIKEPDDATFRADELVEAFQRYSYTNDERNFARNNKKFAYKHNLALRGNMLDVRTYKCGTSEVLPTPESDAKETSSIIYTIELDHSASKIEFYGGGQVGQSYLTDMCERSEKSGSSCDLPIAQLRNIKENQIKSRCLLYREFSEGEIKSHNERFMLATNLLYVRGMKNRFLQWIKKYYDSRDKWEFTWRYISDMKYKPQRCDTMCPYAGRCIHDGSLYLTLGGRKRIERLNPDEEYSSLEECYSELV